MQRQRKRLVYSSLDVQRRQPFQQQKIKRKSNKNSQIKNLLIRNLQIAAKVYLKQSKFLSKQQIGSLLRSNRQVSGQVDYSKKSNSTVKKGQAIQESKGKEKQTDRNLLKNNLVKSERYTTRKKYRSKDNSLLIQSFKQRYDLLDHIKPRVKNFHYNRQSQQLNQPNQQKYKKAVDIVQKQGQLLQKMQQKIRMVAKRRMKSKNSNTNDNLESLKEKMKKKLQKQESEISIKVSKTPKKRKLNSTQSNISANDGKVIEGQQNIQRDHRDISQQKARLTVRNIKGFVVNERDQLVSGLLANQGWKSLGDQSERYTLKWTYKDSYKDYQLLKAANRTGKFMFLNHIYNNKLVNKDDFTRLAENLSIKGINIRQFIPQTFVIGSQYLEFVKNYQIRTVISLISKHHGYFELKSQQNALLFAKPDNSISDDELEMKISQFVNLILNQTDQTVQKQLKSEEQSQFLMVNIVQLYNILVYCCSIWISHEGQESDQFDRKFSKLCSDSNMMSMLISLSKADMLFEKYHQNKTTAKRKKHQKDGQNKLLTTVDGYLKAVNAFMTPSFKIIQAVYLFNEYFNRQLGKKFKGGNRNLWIIKPCTGSKGCGIQITDRMDKISQIQQKNSNKIIQKYIQNIWMLSSQLKQKHNLSYEQSKILLNKKFDIRQWVLIVPPFSYIFSSFYIRVCSQQYEFQSFDNPCSHLSNFSINKLNFANVQESVMSQNQFQHILVKIGKHSEYKIMKNKIRQRLKILADEAIIQCEQIPGTFQILGFDILLDQDFNPWVIECNMSPACSARTEWLKDMKMAMTAGALQLVLDSQLFNIQKQQFFSQYKWQKLSKVNNNPKTSIQKQQINQQNIAVEGKRMKIYKSRNKNQFQFFSTQNQLLGFE